MADKFSIPQALKRFKEIEDDESSLRDNFKECLSFTFGEQWDPKVKQAREAAGRPALTFNRLPTFVQKVSNEARQQKPQIKFNPRHDSDKEVAEIKEGIARQIQYESKAEIASETAVEYSAAASFGFIRLLTEYCDDKSFDQDIKVVPVYDPLTVYGVLVPTCFGQKPNDVFIIEDLPKEQFKKLYPNSKMVGNEWSSEDPNATSWAGTETYRVAECWRVETTPKTIYQLEDGSVVDELPEGVEAKDTRVIQQKKVTSRKMTAAEVLEDTETEWVGDEIPVWAVLGGSKIINGKAKLFSLVQWQMDAQRMINFGKTRIAESLATAPISPFIVAEGQLEGHEAEWQTANSTLRPYLQYKPVSVGGSLSVPPERQTFEPPIQALSAFVMQEVDDLKATSGIFDQSLGSGNNDQSGIAIKSRQQQSDLTNLHFMDNLGRAFQPMGRQIAKIMPIVYSTARIVKIVGPDEVAKMVQINQQHVDPATGKPKHFDLSKGDDDIVVTMGRSFSTKRMESFDMMQSVVQAAPGTLNIIGDLLFRNSDIAGADQLAERFKLMLPPQVQQAESQEGQQIPPQAQQAMAQSQQQLQALHAYAQQIEQKNQELEQEKQAKVVDNQFRMEIEKMKIEADILKAEIATKAQEVQVRMKMEQDMWLQLHGNAHQAALASQQQQHQAGMADQQAASQSDLSAQNAAQAQQQAMAQQASQGQE